MNNVHIILVIIVVYVSGVVLGISMEKLKFKKDIEQGNPIVINNKVYVGIEK